MTPIKLVYDYQSSSFQEYGGVSRYIYELAFRLIKQAEFKTRIIAPIYINQYLKQQPIPALEGIAIPFIPKTQRIRSLINQQITQLYWFNYAPDIVHETYYSYERTAPKSSKVVLTIHDLIHEKFPQFFPASDHTAAMKATAIARADQIICVSENTRNDLLDLFPLDPNQVSVTYLGCSLTVNPTLKVKLTQRSRPYILYVGKRDGYKNFSQLLLAYAHSQNLRQDFDLVCFGSSPLTKSELQMVADLNLSYDQIHYIPGNETTLASWYAGASILVYPSLYEGFGIPPLEAMTCGCPVACSPTSSIPEVVGDAAEFFEPTQPESIAAAIARVLYNSERSQQLRIAGQAQAEKFSWDRCAEKTALIYQSIL
ncbi:glycosyltransferase family 4 protein [Pantanalinema sp. GBBB05]|uniref:glycosyltransferase family 4 protein n=1 Tax=Pantanalinema sp. GBBB05 TaxID=2604139 RepID=UPI001E07CA6A|nr:glycosyltransferase family 4 protein [Pantanalinema sp. GBBB05]